MNDQYEKVVDVLQNSLIKSKWIIFEYDSAKKKRATTLDSDSARIIKEYKWGAENSASSVVYDFSGARGSRA